MNRSAKYILKRFSQNKNNLCQSSHAGKAAFHNSSLCRQEVSSDSVAPLVLVEQYNAVTLIGLNRPSKRNALDTNLISCLREELKKFASNPLSSVAVLYGTGGNFCAGLDLDELTLDKPSLPLVDEFCCKPVIASVNGYAVGEGFDLAMACDVRVTDNQAILGSFNRRFGIPISVPALRRLSASCGMSFALDIILSGRPIKAEEAYQMGLVQQLSPCGASKGNALTYAQSLTKYPQEALRADRAAFLHALVLSDDIQYATESEISSMLPKALEKMQYESRRFSEGVGKHGTFKNLTVQPGWPEWMK
ncbi:2,3-dehydroadipyl-CoA hydratase-like [Frankliniella occidentalis]|uniref:2,3-dehydroadipyl-CoA hydratase-like n=1 Tax=Frankliniella occidentalis TaxID=133901 RepID=A0A6J1SCB9_FRAOC|nr:2,3-dehydroadipyl-CoA hydratase-like [Frankliniella occidentalis]XP_052128287.1 2,3-dehydroadipyl-CoA hydratase-like [Frankliniella occidentalis]